MLRYLILSILLLGIGSGPSQALEKILKTAKVREIAITSCTVDGKPAGPVGDCWAHIGGATPSAAISPSRPSVLISKLTAKFTVSF